MTIHTQRLAGPDRTKVTDSKTWSMRVPSQLTLPDIHQRRRGALAMIYRHLGSHMKLGVGYNFTDFSDDLTDLRYNHKGVFINLVGIK